MKNFLRKINKKKLRKNLHTTVAGIALGYSVYILIIGIAQLSSPGPVLATYALSLVGGFLLANQVTGESGTKFDKFALWGLIFILFFASSAVRMYYLEKANLDGGFDNATHQSSMTVEEFLGE